LVASDEDREGEAISWHLSEELDSKKTKHCFHEITKNAILKAIDNHEKLIII
jgi:DNA topoisomerase-1